MKTRCEKCGNTLLAEGEAYICSYECTYCPECALSNHGSCSRCGGELLRRPRRNASLEIGETASPSTPGGKRFWLIWVVSFAAWTFIAVIDGTSLYQWKRSFGFPATWLDEVTLPLVNFLIFAFFTPVILYIGWRYPVQRNNWGRRTALYLLGGLLFTVLHVVARALVYPVNNPLTGHPSRICMKMFQTLFLYNVANDIFSVYLPLVVIVHASWYYQQFRDREIRTSQLEAQLTKAHLQALKSQLQPHFLFNVLHSISALMLTDVRAADRMMTRLSELLRMSLQNNGIQITTLKGELEFVSGYLEIEKLRFEDRLNVVLDIAPETLDAQVPYLLLQPLVENAVKHGISMRSGTGEIRIGADHDDCSLYLRVRDNGPGFCNGDGGQNKAGLGLRATRERLQTLYGDDQSFEIRSAAEGGVEVAVRIPFRAEPRPLIDGMFSESPEPAA